jgi:hypothetical protein
MDAVVDLTSVSSLATPANAAAKRAGGTLQGGWTHSLQDPSFCTGPFLGRRSMSLRRSNMSRFRSNAVKHG